MASHFDRQRLCAPEAWLAEADLQSPDLIEELNAPAPVSEVERLDYGFEIFADKASANESGRLDANHLL